MPASTATKIIVPTLDNDTDLNDRMRIERKLIAHLIAHLVTAGFELSHAHDGEESIVVTDTKSAMEVIFSVDESHLFVRHPEHRITQSIFIVLGNDGWDCVNDHSYEENDRDGFRAAMDSFDVEQFM